MIEIIVSLLIIVGLVFILAGAAGVYRMPDFYCRAHASGMTSTLGVGFVMLAAVVHFTALTGELAFKLLLMTMFIFFTGPIASHMITRAAYFSGVKQWQGSVLDQMKDYTPPVEEGAVEGDGAPKSAG
ncbi:MAG TPA: monovalent cation/H(+) antiporter subunit G [Clostridia bacterium]|nr:monovalent cation/H(+) antiporter subunit G [Clostridia bacterium]